MKRCKISGTMWNHFLRITNFFQTLYPLRVIYNETTKKFEPVNKSSKLHNSVNAHLTQISVVALARCLYYLKTDSSQLTITFTDFIIDFLFWGITLLVPSLGWSLWKKKYKFAWFLNQVNNQRKFKGLTIR